MSRGFTLIDFVCALGLSGLLLSTALSACQGLIQLVRLQQGLIEVQHNALFVALYLRHLKRSSRALPCQNPHRPWITVGQQLGNDTVTFWCCQTPHRLFVKQQGLFEKVATQRSLQLAAPVNQLLVQQVAQGWRFKLHLTSTNRRVDDWWTIDLPNRG